MEVGKKGTSLACRFQQSMESGDASDEEASSCDPKRKDLMHKEQLKAISMQHHCQKNWLGMYRAKSAHELGIINSPEFFHAKNLIMYSLVCTPSVL